MGTENKNSTAFLYEKLHEYEKLVTWSKTDSKIIHLNYGQLVIHLGCYVFQLLVKGSP